MSDSKESQITIKSDKAAGISSRAHGANIDGVAFNLEFIASKNPVLATTIMKLYEEAAALSADDPSHPDEDYDLALENIRKSLN